MTLTGRTILIVSLRLTGLQECILRLLITLHILHVIREEVQIRAAVQAEAAAVVADLAADDENSVPKSPYQTDEDFTGRMKFA